MKQAVIWYFGVLALFSVFLTMYLMSVPQHGFIELFWGTITFVYGILMFFVSVIVWAATV